MRHRLQKIPFVITCDHTNNTVPTTPPTRVINGILRGIKIKTPATVDASATTAVVITDSDGDALYSKSGIAVATTNIEYQDTNHVPTNVPLQDTITVTPTLSATQTLPKTITVTLIVETFED